MIPADPLIHPKTEKPVIRVADIPDRPDNPRWITDMAIGVLGFSPWAVQARYPGIYEGDNTDLWWLSEPPKPELNLRLPGQPLSGQTVLSPEPAACVPLWLPAGDLLAVRLLAGSLPGFDPLYPGLSFQLEKGGNWSLEQAGLAQIFFAGSGAWEVPMPTVRLRGLGIPGLIGDSTRRPWVLARVLACVWAQSGGDTDA